MNKNSDCRKHTSKTPQFNGISMDNVRGNGRKIKTYSIADLLCTTSFLGNQTKLAKFLKINRGTFRSYMHDINQVNHLIVKQGSEYVFMSVSHRKEL